jgi:hypothetical protein
VGHITTHYSLIVSLDDIVGRTMTQNLLDHLCRLIMVISATITIQVAVYHLCYLLRAVVLIVRSTMRNLRMVSLLLIISKPELVKQTFSVISHYQSIDKIG